MLTVFLNALQSMLSITIITFLGYYLASRKLMTAEVERFIPWLTLNIVIPVYLMDAVIEHFTRDQFLTLIKASIVPFVSIIAVFAGFYLLGLILRIDKKHLGLASVAAATSNTMFIGLPVNTALFGDKGVTPLLLYFFSNTLFFWTIGCWAIAREGTVQEKHRPGFREHLAHIFAPPLRGTLCGVAIVLLDIPVPGLIRNTCSMLGGIATPLALIFVGTILHHVNWKTAHMGKDIALTVLGRFVLSPLVIIAMVHYLPLDLNDITRDVYIIQSGLPAMTNIAIISAYYGADREFGSIFVAVSTLVGILSVPCWMTVLTLYLS